MVHETLRILMIIGRYRPRVGGTEIQAERLAQALVRKGVAVEILTGRERGLAPFEQSLGVLVRRLWIPDVGIPFLNAIVFGAGLYATILRRRSQFDIVHIHQAFYPAWAGVAAATRVGRPSIVKISSSGERLDLNVLSRQAGSIGQCAARHLVRHTGAFIAINDEVAAGLRSWGVPERRIACIPNGIDLPPVATRPDIKLDYRRRLDLPADVPLLLYVGSQRPVKNLPLLITAVQRLVEKGHPVNLVLLGDGEQRPELECQVERGRLEGCILFKGRVTNVLDYLYAADVFVLPSLVEGLSNALLEAMSVGLACIASDIPGNRTLIQPGINGLLFEPGNSEQLTDAILELLSDQGSAEELGRRARLTVEADYSMDHVVGRYISLYSMLLNR